MTRFVPLSRLPSRPGFKRHQEGNEMGRTGCVAVAMVASVFASLADAAAQPSGDLNLPIMFVDEVGAPANSVRRAQAETSRIFKAAGITLTWLPAGEPPAGSLIVKLVAIPLGQRAKNPNVLGGAASSK